MSRDEASTAMISPLMSARDPNSPPKAQVDEASLQQAMDKNKESLKLKLMTRRPIHQLVDQGIIPSLKVPPHYYEQSQKLQRAKREDFLRKKIQKRPDRQALIQQHILEDTTIDPSLQDKQRQLKKARLVDDLNDRIMHRPGPLELVKGNILHADENFEQAVKEGQIPFKRTCEGQALRHPIPSFSLEEDSGSDVALSPPQDLLDQSLGSMPSIETMVLSPYPNHDSPSTCMGELRITSVTPPTSLPSPTLPQVAYSQVVEVAPKESAIGVIKRKKSKPKSSAPKGRIIKFHEYKGPPSAQKSQKSPTDEETSYELLLQQQQLFLQWQLEMQQKYPQVNPVILPHPTVDQSSASTSLSITESSHDSPPPSSQNTILNLEDMKVSELKAELKKRNLPVSGAKPLLLERLRNHIESSNLPIGMTSNVSNIRPKLSPEKSIGNNNCITAAVPININRILVTQNEPMVTVSTDQPETLMVYQGQIVKQAVPQAQIVTSTISQAQLVAPNLPQAHIVTSIPQGPIVTSLPQGQIATSSLPQGQIMTASLPQGQVLTISRPSSVTPMEVEMNGVEIMDFRENDDIVKRQQQKILELERELERSQRQLQHQQLQQQLLAQQQQQALLASHPVPIAPACNPSVTISLENLQNILQRKNQQQLIQQAAKYPSGTAEHSALVKRGLAASVRLRNGLATLNQQNISPYTNLRPLLVCQAQAPGIVEKPRANSLPNGIVQQKLVWSTSVPNFSNIAPAIRVETLDNKYLIPKIPPDYNEAIKGQLKIKQEKQPAAKKSGRKSVKSQEVDDVLDVLISHGELPPSAAQEPATPTTPETQNGFNMTLFPTTSDQKFTSSSGMQLDSINENMNQIPANQSNKTPPNHTIYDLQLELENMESTMELELGNKSEPQQNTPAPQYDFDMDVELTEWLEILTNNNSPLELSTNPQPGNMDSLLPSMDSNPDPLDMFPLDNLDFKSDNSELLSWDS